MNKHLHRIIFNAARGMRMVVQETARSAGKTPGTTAGALGVALAALLGAAPTHGQIVGARNVPGNQRPQVLAAPNGVPLVNIATPSAAGVSRNVYNRFDVDGNGAILNNSRTGAQTQLGGNVQGNPWLAKGPARVILNEVNSGNPSQLRGYIEVAGQRAEVVVANPAGIAVNGGGFINASRATLTTGTPILDAGGGIGGFSVLGGAISIDGKGIDFGATDYAAVLARALQVNAGIWARELKVATGVNRVSADAAQVDAMPAAGADAAPAFALDVSELGGMYAGKITLIGTEAGVGARNAGSVIASTVSQDTSSPELGGVGQLIVTAAGRLENRGTLQSTADARMEATSFANAGRVASGAQLVIKTEDELANTLDGQGGQIEAPRVQLASAGGDIDNRGGSIRQTSAADLRLGARKLSNSEGGEIGRQQASPPSGGTGTGGSDTGGTGDPDTGGAGGSNGGSGPDAPGPDTGTGTDQPNDTAQAPPSAPSGPGEIAAAGTLRNDGGQILAGGVVHLQIPEIDNHGGRLGVDSIEASGASFNNAGGRVEVDKGFSAHVGEFDNRGGSVQAATLQIAASGDLLNRDGKLTSNAAADLSAAGLIDNQRGRISAVEDLKASAGKTFDNGAGILLANQAVEVRAAVLDNNDGSIGSSASSTHIRVDGALLNRAGNVSAATNIELRSGSLHNSGNLRAGGDATLAISGEMVNDGMVVAGGNASIRADRLDGGGDGVIAAGAQSNGSLSGSGSLDIQTRGSLAAHGTLLAAGGARLKGASIDLSGSTTAASELELSAEQGDIDTSAASLRVTGNVKARAAQAIVNRGGDWAAGGLDVHAAGLDNAGGRFAQIGTGTASFAIAGKLDNSQGEIASNGHDLKLSASSLDNTGGGIAHAGSGSFELDAGNLIGDDGSIESNGSLSARVGNWSQDRGVLSAHRIDLVAGSLSNRGGSISQTGSGDTRIEVSSELRNAGGSIASNGTNVLLQADTLDNQGGDLQHAGNGSLELSVGEYAGVGGRITSDGRLTARAQGRWDQAGGSLTAAQLSLSAAELGNQGGSIIQTGAGDTHIAASGSIDNSGGVIASNGRDMSLAANAIVNTNGQIRHAGSGRLALESDSYSGQGGGIATNGALAIAASEFNVDEGRLVAGQLSIDVSSLSNRRGEILQSGTGATRISVAEGLDNSGGRIASNGQDIHLEADSIANGEGRIEHGGSGNFDLSADALDNTEGFILSNGDLRIAAGAYTQDGGTTSASQLTIDAGSLSNRGGEILQTGGGGTAITVAQTLDNAGGTIASNGSDMALKAAAIINESGTIEHAGKGTLGIQTGSFDGRGGSIASNGALVVQAGRFDQSQQGSILARQLTIDANSLNNQGSRIMQVGEGATRITVAGELNNAEGGIASNGDDISLQAGSITNTDGEIHHAGSGTLSIEAQTRFDGVRGKVLSNGALLLKGGDIVQDQGHIGAQQITIDARSLSNREGEIVQAGGGHTSITVAQTLDNAAGTIASNGEDMTLRAAAIVNESGAIEHAGKGTLGIQTRSFDGQRGSIASNGALVVQAGRFDQSQQGSILARQLTIDASSLNNQGSRIVQVGEGATRITVADELDNAEGSIASNGDDVTLQAGSVDNTDGEIQHAGSGALSIDAQARFESVRGKVLSNGALVMKGGDIVQDQGHIGAQQITIDARSLSNREGEIVQAGAGDTSITIAQTLDNASGTIASNGNDLSLKAAAMVNESGAIEHAGKGTLGIKTGSFDGQGGSIASNGALTVQAGRFDQSQKGSLLAQQVTIDAGSLNNQGSRIVQVGEGPTRISIAGELSNAEGSIASNADEVSLQAGSIVNTDGEIQHAGSGSLSIEANTRFDGARGKVVSNGALVLKGGDIVQDQGHIGAQQITIDARSLSNREGEIVQVGTGDTRIRVSGDLANAGGTIASNGRDMLLQSGAVFSNADGEIRHAGEGSLTLDARTYDGRRGTVASNGALRMQGGSFDQDGGSISAQQLTIDAQSLSNRGGQIVQLGQRDTHIVLTERLDNTDGEISSNGENVQLAAAELNNADGLIQHAGSGTLDIEADSFGGARSTVLGNGSLLLRGGDLDQSQGRIVAQRIGIDAKSLDNEAGEITQNGSGDTRIAVSGALRNSGGSISSNGIDMSLSADRFDNRGGTIAHAGDGMLTIGAVQSFDGAHGKVASNGGLQVSGGSFDLDAASTTAQAIAIDVESLSHRGGEIVQAGEGYTHISVAGRLDNSGGRIASNGDGFDLRAGSIVNDDGSLEHAGAGTLNLSVGDFSGVGSRIVSNGALVLQADGFSQDGGSVQAVQVDIDAGSLGNRNSTIIQTGTGDTHIAVAGALDNSLGTIASNGADLSLAAGSFANGGGSLEHAGNGLLSLDLGSYHGPGQLNTNGALAVRASGLFNNDGGDIHVARLSFSAGALSNRGGQIVQTGDSALTLDIGGELDNDTGVIANNGDLRLAAGSISNQSGSIRAAGNGSLVVTTSGQLDNRKGDIGAGADIRIQAGTLRNDAAGSITAAGSLDANVAGAASNAGGLLAANSTVRIAAQTLDNTSGKIGSVNGGLSLNAQGQVSNDKGQMLAAGDLVLDTGAYSNRGGLASGKTLALDTHGHAVDNSLGTLASAGTLTLQSGALGNKGGLIQSGDAMRIDTHGMALDNSDAAGYARADAQGEGGIVSGGSLQLRSGALDNTAGFIGAQGAVTAKLGAVTNRDGGVIQSVDTLSIDTQGADIDNRGGKLQSIGDLSLEAAGATVDNTGGLILSTASTSLKAGTVLNADTQGSDDKGIGGKDVSIATSNLDNSRGAVLANQNATITSSGLFKNESGLVSAGDTLTVADPDRSLVIDNTNGQLVAGRRVQIDAASFQGGRAASKQDLEIRLTQDLVNDSELSADGNLRYSTSGNLTNNGKLSAGNTLTVEGSVVNNTVNGVMTGDSTLVNAGTLNNDGLIDGNKTLIDAGLLNNSGTGRIYGDQVYIHAGTLNNRDGGTVAARQNLDIQAGTINNTEHSYLFSMGDMTLGGGTLNNFSAQVESLGDMTLNVGTINNFDTHFTIVRQDLGETTKNSVIPTGLGKEVPLGWPLVLSDTDRSWAYIENGQSYMGYGWTWMVRTEHAYRDVAGSPPDPGRIVAGGDMTINGMLHNRDSQVLAGGRLNISPSNIDNTPTQGLQVIDHGGIATFVPGSNGSNVVVTDLPVQREATTIDVGKGIVEDGRGANSGYRPPDQTGGAGVPVDLAEAGGVVAGPSNSPIIEVPSAVQGSDKVGAGSGAQSASGDGATTNHASSLAPDIAQGASGASGNRQDSASADSATRNGGNVDSASTARASTSRGRNLDIGMSSIAPKFDDGVGFVGNDGMQIAVDSLGRVAGDGAARAGGGAASSGASSGPGRISAGSSGPMVVRTGNPNSSIPNASLFQLRPDSTSRYLVATDNAFTRGAGFTSSDQLLGALGYDPALTLKRLGDGFYEQKLIREQIANLTGYRYLAGYSDDQTEYSALLSAGATFAQQYNLTLGVALSAAQMAQLTSDIVWLVEQTVTLPDGSTQRVLVPQVYVRVQKGDIDGSGSLLSADAMVIKGSGDLNNQGTLAGRTMLAIDADNVNNLGGRIAGGNVAINARNDLNNIGGSITAANSAVLTAGNDINIQTTTRSSAGGGAAMTNIDRIAGVYVSNPGGVLIASAGHDVNLIGAALASQGGVAVGAGNNVNLGTVTESSSRVAVGGTRFALAESQSREVGSAIVGKGDVRIAAGNDLNVRAGAIASVDGGLVASAGRDINITAGEASSDLAVLGTNSSKSTFKKSSSANFDSTGGTDVLSSSLSGNTVALVAGNDINAQAAQLRSEGAMSLAAGRDVNLTTATQTTLEAHASQSKTSGTGLGKIVGASVGAVLGGSPGLMAGVSVGGGGKSATGASSSTVQEAIGTSVSAGSLQVVSGRDTTLSGATVVADHDITVIAGRNLTIESAQNSGTQASAQSSSKSGWMGGASVGTTKGFDATAGSGTSQSASQVASLQGDVTLVAGQTYRQTGSSVLAAGLGGSLAGGDVNILARDVIIEEAANTALNVAQGRHSSTVLGLSVSANVAGFSTDSLKGAGNTLQAMGDTGDSRMQALGAVNLAMTGKQVVDAADALANGGSLAGYKVSATVSRTKSQYESASAASQAVGSGVVGANNVNIVATGGGEGSNIRVSGSTIAAGNTVNLAADNDITLQASQDSFIGVGRNTSSGASVGVGFAAGSQSGIAIDLGVSQGKGRDNQNEVIHNNARVSGASAVNIASGGDLELKGAVVEGNRVSADVGGNLNIESLQDVSIGHSQQSSSGLSLSLCIPPICYGASSVGVSAAGAKADGVHISVNEQSGIKAGDGGFTVKVQGDTTLKGAVIESTQVAVDQGRNRFETGGELSLSDLENRSWSNASSYAVSGSVGFAAGDQSTAQSAADKAAAKSATEGSKPGGSAGVGSAGSSQTSTTKSGISGIAGDESVRTGDNSSAGTLVKEWNTQALVKDVQAQATITAEFSRNASIAVGSYANSKLAESASLYEQAAAESDPARKSALYAQADELQNNWKEGGAYRIAAHAAVGGLTGGAVGAAGAAASGLAVPAIADQIAELDMPAPVKQALAAAIGGAVGASIGGSAGGAAGFTETTNNFLTANDLRNKDQKIAVCRAGNDPGCEVNVLKEYELRNANNTGELKRSSLIEKQALEQVRGDLEQLLLDPQVSEGTKAEARKSIKELNTAINVIDKAPVIRDAAELGLMAADVALLGEFAVAKTLTSAVVKELVAARTGKSLSDEAATRIVNSFYRDGAELPQALATSSGTVVQATPGKTTTVLGTFKDDTGKIIDTQLGLPKSLGHLEPKDGGFNLLNVPDQLYKDLGPQKFWEQVNKPFLDAAVSRGDDIYLATKPTDVNIVNPTTYDGLSGFGRELDYLQSKGYVYNEATGKMCYRGCR